MDPSFTLAPSGWIYKLPQYIFEWGWHNVIFPTKVTLYVLGFKQIWVHM